MADIFHEVDEIMKQERMEKFWKENRTWIIAFIALTILGTAAISGYKYWNNGVKETQTAALIELLDQENFPDSVIKISEEFRPGIRGIALLAAAQHEMDAEKPDKALVFYKRAAEDKHLPAEFREMGQIMTARLDEDLSAEQKLKLLKNVIDNSNSPWRYRAHMESALIQAHNTKNYAAARFHLQYLLKNDAAIPPSLINKAKSLDHIYSLKQKAIKDQNTITEEKDS